MRVHVLTHMAQECVVACPEGGSSRRALAELALEPEPAAPLSRGLAAVKRFTDMNDLTSDDAAALIKHLSAKLTSEAAKDLVNKGAHIELAAASPDAQARSM